MTKFRNICNRNFSVIFATGQFIADEATKERSSINYSDPWLYEEDGDSLPLPEKESFTPEEVLDIILKDMRQICKEDA